MAACTPVNAASAISTAGTAHGSCGGGGGGGNDGSSVGSSGRVGGDSHDNGGGSASSSSEDRAAPATLALSPPLAAAPIAAAIDPGNNTAPVITDKAVAADAAFASTAAPRRAKDRVERHTGERRGGTRHTATIYMHMDAGLCRSPYVYTREAAGSERPNVKSLFK